MNDELTLIFVITESLKMLTVKPSSSIDITKQFYRMK